MSNPYQRQAKAKYEASPLAEAVYVPLYMLPLAFRKQQENINCWGKKGLTCVPNSKVIRYTDKSIGFKSISVLFKVNIMYIFLYTIYIFICTLKLGSGTQSTLKTYSIWILFSIIKMSYPWRNGLCARVNVLTLGFTSARA